MIINEHELLDIVSCSKETSIKEISKLLEKKYVKYCVIINEFSQPIGIISVQDIVFRGVSKNLDLNTKTAQDIMTKEIEVIPIESSKEELIEHLKSLKTHSLPVTKNKKVIGMIDIWSLWNYLHKHDSIESRIELKRKTNRRIQRKLKTMLHNFETYN